MIAGRVAIKQEYSRPDVAESYVGSRFENDGLGRALHERQVGIVREIFARVAPNRVLEIAPGPARVSVHIPQVAFRCAVEQSPAMLEVGRKRLEQHGAGAWQLIRGDGFQLPVAGSQFDLAMTFRFVRHFPGLERKQLFAEIRRVLRPGGRLVLDVPNSPMYAWWFNKMGVDAARVDDYWFLEKDFVEEMRAVGFRVERLLPIHSELPSQFFLWHHVGRRSYGAASLASRAMSRLTRRRPLEWVACCQCA